MISHKALGGTALDLIFPPVCSACGEMGQEPFCRVCLEAVLPGSLMCLHGFGWVRARWIYGGPVASAIQRMKYDRRIDIARSLGQAFLAPSVGQSRQEGVESAAALQFLTDRRVDLVVPVPLDGARLRRRSFNPVMELCRAWPFDLDPWVLKRVQGIPSQVGLGPSERRRNVRGVFRLDSPKRVENRNVLLVDDVLTTGSTLISAAHCLREAGARSVCGFVLAWARSDDPNIQVISPVQ